MAISYFDSAYYLTQKLAQLQKVDPSGELNGGKPWTTTEEVSKVLADQGFTPESHFEAYGKFEDLSPVKEFNADEYYALKAAQLNAMNDGAGFEPNGNAWTAAQAKQAINDAGLSAWDHYVQYGSKEGVSPSNSLDEGKYLQAKAEALNAANYEGRSDWTPEQVKAAIEQGGMTVLDHYEQYAGKGDLEAAAIPASGPNPYEVSDQPTPTPGEELTLTTGKDVLSPTAEDPAFRTTADADVINGEVKTPSTSTLNDVDQIDGGDGMDTLNVAMHNNFNGFTDGFMKNVEVVNLTNDGSKPYSFSTKNMEGVETYNLKGAVNLKDVASTDAAVNLADLASGTMSVAYTADAVKGTEDALKLGLSNVGTAGEGKAEKSVSVTAAGIENLNVTASGANVVDLSGVKDATALNVAGDGSLKVTAVGAGVKDVDASTATGALNLNLSAATNVESVKLGSGDDTVTVKNIKVDAALDGGAGNDEVIMDMKGVTDAVVKQPQMTGVETLTFKDAAVKTTISGATTTGLETVKVQNLTGEIVLAEMNNESLNVVFDGVSAGTVTVADDLALTINAAGDTAATVSTGVTAAKASSVSLNVDGKMSYTGTLTAVAATEVKIAVNGEGVMGGKIVADSATDVTLDATSSKGVTFGADSSFKAVQNLNLNALADVSINGVGGESQAVTVDGAGVKGNLTLDVAATNVDAAEVTVTGSNLGVNTITVETGYDNIKVTGGIQDDTVTLAENFAAATGSEKSLTVDLGTVSSGDTLTVGNGSTPGTIDFTGWNLSLNGVDIINAVTSGATLKMDADVLSGQKVTIGATADASFTEADFSGTDESDTIDFANITGNVTKMVIDAGAGDDVITAAGISNQYIIGGDGADSIYLDGAGSTAHIQYNATDITAMSAEGGDHIYGFEVSSGGDVIDFAAGLLRATNGSAITVDSINITNGTLSLTDIGTGSTGIYGFTYTLESVDATAIANEFSAGDHMVTVSGSSAAFVFAMGDGTDTYLYLFSNENADSTVDANELHLIGVLDGVDAKDLTADNFNVPSA